MHKNRLITIWATYGPYHLARVQSLINVGFLTTCLSYAKSDTNGYPFFNQQVSGGICINDCDISKINPFTSFIRTFNVLVKSRPDLILACGYERPESLASIIYSTLFSVKVFLLSVNQEEDKKRIFLVELIKKYYIRLFDGVVVGGNTHLQYFNKLQYPLDQIAVGYNCVDNEKISIQAKIIRTHKLSRLSPYENYFLCIARFIPKKNLSTLIYAYLLYKEEISPEFKPWNLVICGEGKIRGELEEVVQKNSLVENVHFPGQIDDLEDIINYYSYAKSFILPSSGNEQWGLVVNEAMTAGLPVIVSQQCGCSSNLVQNGINGFVFDANSKEALCSHMLWMHRNQEKLPQMGEHSFEIISKYSPDAFAANVKDLYQKTST